MGDRHRGRSDLSLIRLLVRRGEPCYTTAMKSGSAYPLGNRASVLFSGGTDSTLAAYEIAVRTRETTLLTLDPGFIFFVENSRRHADLLRQKIGADRVRHEIIPIRPLIRQILFGNLRHDVPKYGFNLTSLVCLGCRMSMHTAAVIYNLEHNIPVIADGSIQKQAEIPEQLELFIRHNRRRLWARFGIRHYSPIYDVGNSDRRIDELGLSTTPALKQQFILFDTQPTCPFGVPADVYAKIFYGHLAGPAREVDTFEYSEEKYPAIYAAIERHFAGAEPGLEALVNEARKVSDRLPESWEEIRG